jgi:MerR family transcriptional regulator, light-induced transcriptional regulator
VYSRILQPALAEVGRLWHLGESSVADEHLATATVERVMARLRPHFNRAGRRNRTVLATSVSGDLHAIGVRMVADFFEMDGWDALCLGANTPGEDVQDMLRSTPANLLAVSASGLLHLRELGEMIAAVRAAPDLAGLPILVGGAAFNTIPDLWREVGADGSASSAAAAVDAGNRLAT